MSEVTLKDGFDFTVKMTQELMSQLTNLPPLGRDRTLESELARSFIERHLKAIIRTMDEMATTTRNLEIQFVGKK